MIFSSVSDEVLSNLGVGRKILAINADVLAQRSGQRNADPGSPIARLCDKITLISQHVGFQYGARMILDGVLLTVAELLEDGPGVHVALFPGLQVATGKGVRVANPATQFEVSLTGNVDYALCTFAEEYTRDRVLKARSMQEVMRLTNSRIMFVKGKRDSRNVDMPEAIAQAIAFAEVTRTNTLRFCLSDGQSWIFSLIAKDDQGNWTCYEGQIYRIPDPTISGQLALPSFRQDVRNIVELVYWLVASDDPINDPLYSLRAVQGAV